jgi:membrane-associated protease RseP (regulator of RpoE activity)
VSGGSPPGPAPDADDLARRLELARQHVEALLPGAVAAEGPQPVFLLLHREDLGRRFLELQRRLAPLGLLPLLRREGGRPALILIPKPPSGPWAPQTNALLFVATVATTFLAGYLQSIPLVQDGYLTNAVMGGLAFSGSLLFILVAHEMGHKLVAIRRGIDASLPYFLPMVPPIGTMGAVIVTRTPAPNRDSLMDLGASGPLLGFVAAIPVLVWGISHSFILQPGQLEGLEYYAEPLVIRWLIQALLHIPPGGDVLMHPVLFAGWIGLLVTSLNLLPSGMLDGGHAVRAAFGGRTHLIVSYLGIAIAVVMGAYLMAALMAVLIRRGHVGPLDDLTPLSPSRRLVGAALVAIFLVSVTSIQPFPNLLDLFR